VIAVRKCQQFPVLLILLLSGRSTPVRADQPVDRQVWNFFSGTGAVLYLAAGVGVPLIEDGRAGKNRALRSADSLLTTTLLTEGLKALVQEKRPDSNSHDSFPSGHASAAFAIAAAESGFHPNQAIYWYSGATLIAASRVGLHRHTVGDVLAGGLLGYGVARLELSSRRGLLLYPFIQPEKRASGLALSLSY
jgi:membrane-associated phospholipid phosphatase